MEWSRWQEKGNYWFILLIGPFIVQQASFDWDFEVYNPATVLSDKMLYYSWNCLLLIIGDFVAGPVKQSSSATLMNKCSTI